MKKLKLVVLTCLLGLLVMSCGKDDPSPSGPSVSATSAQLVDEVFKGVFEKEDLVVKISGSAPQGFGKLIISKTVDGVTSILTTVEKPSVIIKNASYEYDYTYKIIAADILKEVILTAEVQDAKGLKASATIAKVRALRKLSTFELSQNADDSETEINDYDYFLVLTLAEAGILNNEIPKAYIQSLEGLNKDHEYGSIYSIFDFNPTAKLGLAQGAYFASPKAVVTTNSKLVQSFTTKNETQFKIAEYTSLSLQDNTKLQALTENDPHFIADLFTRLPDGTNPQLVSLNKPTAYFVLFKTGTGHVALIDNITFGAPTQVSYRLHISTRP